MGMREKLPDRILRVNVAKKIVSYYDYYAVTFSGWDATKAHITEVVREKTSEKINIPEEPYHHGNGHFTLFFESVQE